MAWAKIDDGWWCHPKTMQLTVSASGLWALALSWSCHQRRDVVPRRFLAMVDAHDEHAKELVDVGLWHETPEGWRIHNWADYQERTLSEKRADAGRKGGKASGQARREATDEANTKQEGSNAKQEDEADDEAGALPGPALPDLDQDLPSTDVDREAAEIGPDDAADEPDPVAETFEQFWKVYPPRKGRKDGKGNALIEWRKLTLEERRRAYRGAKHLAQSDQLPKDAERFLRRAKGGKGDFPFDDWQDPPVSSDGPEGRFFGGVPE